MRAAEQPTVEGELILFDKQHTISVTETICKKPNIHSYSIYNLNNIIDEMATFTVPLILQPDTATNRKVKYPKINLVSLKSSSF